MKWSSPVRQLGLAVVAFLLVAACGSSPSGTASCNAKTATSATDCGGLDGLVTAAKAEGTLNVIALPPDWANYGAVISGFTAKYGIQVNSANPNGSSQDEVNAFDGTSNAPDVVDVGQAVALANTAKFAPYKVATWNDIPAGAKEATGLWFNDYGGYMGIGYNPAKVPGGVINSVSDLLGSGFKSEVALAGDPTKSNQGLNGVIMAAVANGGSLDDVSAGVELLPPTQAKRQLRAGGGHRLHGEGGPDPCALRVGLPVHFPWQVRLGLEDLRSLERHHRWVLQPGDQQSGAPPGGGSAVGRVPVLRRRPKPMAQGRRATGPHGGHDHGWDD